MLELFVNPVNMIIGGALISSPIIIHLINRMRFKRIRWAAMEFLLKSQKRNRRRLIIEQLLLLLLRILLVLLAGLLLARFLGFSLAAFFQPRGTTHVIILDDRLSMSDSWKGEDGARKNCFQVGKERVEKDIGKAALRARSAQRLVLLRLSDCSLPEQQRDPAGPTADAAVRVVFDERLNDDTLKKLGRILADMGDATKLHLKLADGVKAAKKMFTQTGKDERVLHIVSDLRTLHWGEAEQTALDKELEPLIQGQNAAQVKLIDTAHPIRSENAQVAPLYHDNLAITELQPETRVAAENVLVQFTVKVANYSASDRKGVRVTVKVDGSERPEGSLTIMDLPAAKTVEKTFQILFTRPTDLEKAQPYFAQITANLENEEAGLQGDNIRYAVVEVRRQVPVLIIDGDLTNGDKPGGDTYHLRAVLTVAKGYDVRARGPSELELPNLDQYPCIYLVNVPDLTEKALKNLERYVREGGSVAFFVGPRVRPDYYNKYLYANGTGIFPVPLADQPTRALSEEEKQQKALQALQTLAEPPYQLFVRPEPFEQWPIFQEVYKWRAGLQFISFDRYWPVPRSKWTGEARQASRAVELATLPNERPVSDYETRAKNEILDKLPISDPRYEKYRAMLEVHRRMIQDALGGKSVQALASAVDSLLHDPGDPNDPQRPSLEEFWRDADEQLRKDVEKFRDAVQLGDPFCVAGRHGSGRMIAFLTTAGTLSKWNDWAGGSFGYYTYPMVIHDMQKFLTSLDKERTLLVGSDLPLELDSTRYEPKMQRYYQPETREAGATGPVAGLKDLGEQRGKEEGDKLLLGFNEAREPGVYLLKLTQRAEPGVEPRTETRAYAFNVDAVNESDLKRAGKSELEKAAGGGEVVLEGRPAVDPNRQVDLSESPWFYLVFVLILLAEQALAVRLSFHLEGGEAQLPAQAVRPQAA